MDVKDLVFEVLSINLSNRINFVFILKTINEPLYEIYLLWTCLLFNRDRW